MTTGKTTAGTDKRILSVVVSPDMHLWLKVYAATHSVSMSDIIVSELEKLRGKEAKPERVEQMQ